MAPQINTEVLTEEIFQAEQRKTLPSFDPEMPRNYRKAGSGEEVLQDYANEHTGGDLAQLAGHLYAQGFRTDEVVNLAATNPYGLDDYRKTQAQLLNKEREAVETRAPEFATKPESLQDAPAREIGTEGLLSADLDPDEYKFAMAHPVDEVYPEIKQFATDFYNKMDETQKGELTVMDQAFELNYDYLAREVEKEMEKKKVRYDDPKYEEIRNKELKRQLNGWLAMRTVGLHSATIRMSASELFEGAEGPIDVAVAPSVRFIGIGKTGYPMYLTESGTMRAVRLFDTVEGGISGMLKYTDDVGPIDAAARGISEGADFMGQLADFGKTTGIPGGKYLFGTLGFGASLATPDVTSIVAQAGKSGKKFVQTSKQLRSLMDMAGGVTTSRKVANVLEEAAEKIARGVEAENAELIEEGTKQIEALKGQYEEFAREFDRHLEKVGAEKAAFARKLVEEGKVDPDDAEEILTALRASGEAELPKFVKPSEDTVAFSAKYELRPAVDRLDSLKGTKSVTPIPLKSGEQSIYNTARRLRVIDEAAASLTKAGKYEANASHARKVLQEEFEKALDAQIESVNAIREGLFNTLPLTDKEVKSVKNAFRRGVKRMSDDHVQTMIEHQAGMFDRPSTTVNEAIDAFSEVFEEVEKKLGLGRIQKRADAQVKRYEDTVASVEKKFASEMDRAERKLDRAATLGGRNVQDRKAISEIFDKVDELEATSRKTTEKLDDEALDLFYEARQNQEVIDKLAKLTPDYTAQRDALLERMGIVSAVVERVKEIRAEARALKKVEDIHKAIYEQAKRLRELGVPEEAIAKLHKLDAQANVVTELAKKYTASVIKRAKSDSYLRTIKKKLAAGEVESAYVFKRGVDPKETAQELRKLRNNLKKAVRVEYRKILSEVGSEELERTNAVLGNLKAKLRTLDGQAARANKKMLKHARKRARLERLARAKVDLKQKLLEKTGEQVAKLETRADKLAGRVVKRSKKEDELVGKAQEIKRKASDAVHEALDPWDVQHKPSALPLNRVAAEARMGHRDLSEALAEMTLDVWDRAVRRFYKEGDPTYAARKQLEAIRKGVLWNAKTYGDAAESMARILRADRINDPRFAEYVNPVKRLQKVQGVSALWRVDPELDPESVANVLDVWEVKYGLRPDAVVEAINKGTPIALVVDGKEILFSARYLGEQQNAADVVAYGRALLTDPTIAFHVPAEALPATSFTSAIDRWLFRGSEAGKKRWVLGTIRDVTIGGHVHPELNELSEWAREAALEIPRSVAQTISDTAQLIRAGDYPTLYKMFSGEGAKFDNGRHILSSRSASVTGSYGLTINKFLDRIPVEDRHDIIKLLDYPLTAEGKIDVDALRASERLSKAYDKLIRYLNSGIGDGRKGIDEETVQSVDTYGELIESEALRMPNALKDVIRAAQQGRYRKATEATAETLGLIRAIYKAGEDLSDPVYATEKMFKDIQRAYSTANNQEAGWRVVNAIAPVMAAHTTAASILHKLGDYNLLLDLDDYRQWKNYVQALPIKDEFRNGPLAEIRRMFGSTIDMTPVDVMGEVLFIPKSFGTKHKEALKRAIDQSDVFAGTPATNLESKKRAIEAFSNKVVQQRVTGTILFRSPFGIDMIREGADNTFTFAGLQPSLIHTFRMFGRVPSMLPGFIQGTHVAQRMLKRASKYVGESTTLDNADVIAKQLADLAEAASPDALLRLSDHITDKLLKKLDDYLGAAKWGASVNDIIDGTDELVKIHGKMYSYSTLRSLAVGRGVTGGAYQANYFSNEIFKEVLGESVEGASKGKLLTMLSDALDLTREESKAFIDLVQNYAELLGERERIGLFVTLINAGQTPVEAAANVTKILHDYQTRATKWDRSWFIKMLVPFWSYRKNNARLMLDAMTNPATAYRLSMSRKLYARSGSALQSWLNDRYTDEFGVEKELMEEEDRKAYDEFVAEMYRLNNGEEFTKEEMAVIRAMMLGVHGTVELEGKFFKADFDPAEVRRLMSRVDFEKYMGLVPNPAALISPWHRDRQNILLPKSISGKRARELRSVQEELEWNYITLPEAGQMAALRHFVTLGSLSLEVAMGIGEAVGAYDTGLPLKARAMHTTEQVKELLSVEFMPFNRLILENTGMATPEASAPVRIPEPMARVIQAYGAEGLITVDEVVREGVLVKEKRFYIPSWAATYLNLAPAPEGAIRDISGLRKTVNISTYDEPVWDASLLTLRLMGLRVERTQAKRVMRMSEPKPIFR